MARSVLDTLPADLAFLAPAVRQMLAVHEANRPPVDAREEPERAIDAEIAACFEQDATIIADALRQHLDGGDRQAFAEQVRQVRSRLFEWLDPHKRRPLTAETRLLFGIVGMLGHPVWDLPRTRRRRTGR